MSSQLHLIENLQATWSDDRGRPREGLSWRLFYCNRFRKIAAGNAPVAAMNFLSSLSSR